MRAGKQSQNDKSDRRERSAAHSGNRALSVTTSTRSISTFKFVVFLVMVGLFAVSCGRRAAAPPPPPPQAAAPPPSAPAPAVTLSATPASIDQGGATTLEWSARNSNNVRIEPGIGGVPASGTRSVSPNSSVTYTATATGPGGTSTDTVRVTVNAAAPPPTAPPIPDRPAATVEELFNTTVQPIYFDYDQAELRADQVRQLQSNVRFLAQNAGLQFAVSGHADERGSQEYNIGLGDRRANAVRQYLIEQGIGQGRSNTVSFGEDRPVCTDTTEGCFQRNRRVEFVLR